MIPAKRFKAVVNPRPEVFIITCFDPRFENAIDAFPFEILGLEKGKFILTRPGGGPTPLAFPIQTPNRCRYAMKQIFFTLHKFPTIKRLVLVSHGGRCGYHATVPNHQYFPGVEKQELSFAGRLAEDSLQKDYSYVKVELFHAELVNNDTEIEFEEVAIATELAIPSFDCHAAFALSSQ